MIKVFECTQEIYNFQNMIRNLEDFCKTLPLDLYASYVYDTSRNEDEYYVSISDFETYEDRIVTYIRFKYYPNPAFLRNSNGRLDLPGPTQEAA